MRRQITLVIAVVILIVGCSNKQAEMERQRKEAEMAAQKEAADKAAAEQAAAKAAAAAATTAAAKKKSAATVAKAPPKASSARAKSDAKDKDRGLQEVVVDSAKSTGNAVETGAKKNGEGHIMAR